MKIDTAQTLKSIRGEVLKDEKGDPVTLGSIMATALLAQVQGDDATGAEKAKRFALAVKVSADDLPVDLTVEEAAKIKELVGKAMGALVVGQVWNAIENAGKQAGPKAIKSAS